MKQEFDGIYELANHFEDKRNAVQFPVFVVRPIKSDSETNTEYGKRLDIYEQKHQEYKKAKQAARAAGYAIEEEFKIALLDYLEISQHPKAHQLYSLALSKEHGSGLAAIATLVEELSELLK